MMELTKGNLKLIAKNKPSIYSSLEQEMARQLIAVMEQEPVGYFYEDGPKNWYQIMDGDSVPTNMRRPLYAAPQLPQPAVVVSEEHSKKLFDEWSGGDGALGELRESGVPDEFIFMLKEFSLATWEACREALLQHHAPFIVTNDHRMMEMPQVEDIDAVAAMLQGAEPVQADTLRDGWVVVPVEPTIAILDEFDSIIDYGAEDSKDAWSRLLAAAWIKSLPAAPQQEVTTDNTTQQKMEIPHCSKHPETELQVHPFGQLMSYPPRPVMYCPLCRPEIAMWAEEDKQLRNYWKDKR